MATWCATSGAALLAGAAWMHSSARQSLRRMEVAEKAPLMKVEDIWVRLRKEQTDNPKLRPAVFAKLITEFLQRGQTWVPESFAVRDGHGHLQAYARNDVEEVAMVCKWEAGKGTEGRANGKWLCNREKEQVESITRGSCIYLLDGADAPTSRPLSYLQERVERLKGKLSACDTLNYDLNQQAPEAFVRTCDRWKAELRELKEEVRGLPVGGSGGGGRGGGGQEGGGGGQALRRSIRIDDASALTALLTVNQRKWRPYQTGPAPPPTWDGHRHDVPPPPQRTILGVSESESVIPLGRPLFAVGHVTLQPSASGDTLVFRPVGKAPWKVGYGTEDEWLKTLGREAEWLAVTSKVMGVAGMALLVAGAGQQAAASAGNAQGQ